MKAAAVIMSGILVLAGCALACYAIGFNGWDGDNDLGWIAALLIIVGYQFYPENDD